MVDTRAGNSGPINQTLLTGNIAAPVAVGAAVTVQQSVTVSGVAVGDRVVANPASGLTIPAGLFIAYARVTATDTVQVALGNVTAGSLNWPAGDLHFSVEKA